MKKLITLLLAFLIGTAAACSKKADSWKGRIELEDGIKVTLNPKEPLLSPEAITLTSELVIGRESDRKGTVIFRNLAPYGCVDTDISGNIYILDSGADTIFKVDPQGDLLKSFGRHGQGPGEFQSPGFIKVMPDGAIAVVDDIGHKLVRFDKDGTFLGEDRINVLPEITVPSVDSQGGIVAMLMEEGERLALSMNRILPGLRETIRFAEKETRRIFDGSTLDLYVPQFRFALTGNDHIVWGFQNDYLLNISNLDGKILRKIRKDYDLIPITEADFRARLKDAFQGRSAPQNITPVHPPHYWPFSLLIADEKGRILARTPAKSPDGKMKYDLFDEEGKFVASIGLGGFAVRWKDDRLFVLEESPETGQVLRCLSVHWN
jgi:hypothetical protein